MKNGVLRNFAQLETDLAQNATLRALQRSAIQLDELICIHLVVKRQLNGVSVRRDNLDAGFKDRFEDQLGSPADDQEHGYNDDI